MNMFKKLSLSALMLTACLPMAATSQADLEKALSQMTPEQQEKLVKEAQQQIRAVAKDSDKIVIFGTIASPANKNNIATPSRQVQKLKNVTYHNEQKAGLYKMLPSLFRLTIKSGGIIEFSGGPIPKNTPMDLASNCSNLDDADVIILVLEFSRTNQTDEEWEAMVFESFGINMIANLSQDEQIKFFEDVLPQLSLYGLPVTLKTFFIDSGKLAQA